MQRVYIDLSHRLQCRALHCRRAIPRDWRSKACVDGSDAESGQSYPRQQNRTEPIYAQQPPGGGGSHDSEQ